MNTKAKNVAQPAADLMNGGEPINTAENVNGDALDLGRFRSEVNEVEQQQQIQQVALVNDEKAQRTQDITEFMDMIQAMIFGIVGRVLPSVGEIMTHEVQHDLSGDFAAVAVKRGWFKDGVKGKYKEELTLFASVSMLGMAIYPAAMKDIEALKAKAVKKPVEKQIEQPPSEGGE